MTVLQIIIFVAICFFFVLGYKTGHADGYKEGRYASKIGGLK